MALSDAIVKAAKKARAMQGAAGAAVPSNATAAVANPSAGTLPAAHPRNRGIISSRLKGNNRGRKLAQPGGKGMLPPPVAKPAGSGVTANTVPTMTGKVAAPVAPAPQANTTNSRPTRKTGY